MDTLQGLSISLDDVIDMLKDRAERHSEQDDLDNVSIQMTLPPSVIEECQEGIDSLDVDIEDRAEQMFLVTWNEDHDAEDD